jgi:hypothetical protein
LASGEAARTDDAGECFKADLAGERSRRGGTCFVASTVGVAEKCAERAGLGDGERPRLRMLDWPPGGGADTYAGVFEACTTGLDDEISEEVFS